MKEQTTEILNKQTLEILLAILSTLTVIFGAWLKIQSDKLRDIKSKLSDKKYNTYQEILSILFDLITQTKKIKEIPENEILLRIFNVKRDLILYGNDKMIEKFFEWEDNQLKGAYRLWNWAELAEIARKDMGNRWTKINADQILRSLFTNKKEYVEFKKEFILQ